MSLVARRRQTEISRKSSLRVGSIDRATPILKLSSYRVAKELGVAAPTVNEIVRRRRAITAEMALRLSRYFGTTAQLWQNLQTQYGLEIASKRIGKKVERAI
jgi:addiction module HigA family antidote